MMCKVNFCVSWESKRMQLNLRSAQCVVALSADYAASSCPDGIMVIKPPRTSTRQVLRTLDLTGLIMRRG